MALGEHRLIRPRPAAWLTLVAGLAATAALGWHLHSEAVAMDRQRLALRVAEVQSQLDARLEKSEMLLHNLRDYLMWSGENREKVFQRWCYDNGLAFNCPWLYGIAVATNRNQAQWRAQLPTPPETWTPADRKTLHELAGSHVLECDIALTSEVKDRKQFLADYDLKRLYRDKDQFALDLKSSRVGMSEHRTVMRDANSNQITGTLFFVPVNKTEAADLMALDGSARPIAQPIRWLHLTSVILSPVDFKVLAESVWDGVPADLGMELFSSTNQTATNCLSITVGMPHAADPKFKAYLTQRQTWPMYGMKFSIFFYTTPLFEAQSPRRLARIVMAAGTILTLLATALVGVALRARNRQELLTEQIREARDALAAAQAERNKISRDLHDGTIQSLYALQLGLEQTVEKFANDPAKAGRELAAVGAELDTVIAEIRQFITADASADQSVDFCAVLQALVRRARAGPNVQIALRCEPGTADRLAAAQAVQLANIAREALSNSLRHASPQRVEIALRGESESVVLEISDDGTGFDPRSPSRPGVGLTSMMARAQEVGGTLEIESSPRGGTRIAVRVPTGAVESNGAEEPANATDES